MHNTPTCFNVGAFECVVFNDHQQEYNYDDLANNISAEELPQILTLHGIQGKQTIMDYNVLLIKTSTHNILIDAGIRDGALPTQLQAAGISPEDIDLIYLTHADSDHVEGLVDDLGNLDYPNARIFMWEAMWKHWSVNNVLVGNENAPEYFIQHVIPAIEDRVELVALDTEILPGIQVIFGRGHSAGHSALRISSEGETLLHIADVVQDPLHIMYPDILCSWDESRFPEEVVSTRKQLLMRAVNENSLVFCPHMPFPGLGQISIKRKTWNWKAIEVLS